MDWFRYDNGHCHERVKDILIPFISRILCFGSSPQNMKDTCLDCKGPFHISCFSLKNSLVIKLLNYNDYK